MARKIKYIVVHHTGASKHQTVESIKRYWRQAHPGWMDRYGYHTIIPYDGSQERLTPDEKVAFGVAGHNDFALHVCCIGGAGGRDERSEAQKATLLKRLTHWKKLYPDAEIVGHRDLSPDRNGDGEITPDEWVKLCPGFNAREEYAHL